MKQKILTFITDGEKFLALRNNSADKKHGGDFWFIVTGEVEKGENPEKAAEREVKEETNLDVKEVFSLNWGSIYDGWQGVCKELNFISWVEKNSKIVLDMIEKVEFKWLELEDFVSLIRWDDNKDLLKKVLKKALKKEKSFDKLNLIDYRK